MNSSAPVRPRWWCRVVRGWSALFAKAPSGHAARCAACQEFFAQSRALEQRLQRDARPRERTIPAGLEQRIIAAIPFARPVRREPPVRTSWFVLAGAGAGAAAAVALAVLALRSPPGASAPIARHETSGAPQVAVVAPETMQVWEASIAGKNPLQREINSVYSDARSALRFLALNFLPADAVPELLADPSAVSSS